MNLDEKIAQAEQQERALTEGLADIRGYLRALREVRDAVIAAARAEVEPVAEPVEEA